MTLKNYLLPFIFTLALLSNPLLSQQDELGNWLMYFGTNRISDDLSIHSEIQYRNHKVQPTTIEQLLLRTGLNYHVADNAILTLGYGYIASHDFESEQKEPEFKENRIFQQLILTNKIGRVKFEHRYRYEQRWINNSLDLSSTYKDRLRYRLMLFLPLNNPTITEKTIFLGVYNEIFMNTKQVFFDRNRFYTAVGYQIDKMTQVQVGYLRQRVNGFGKDHIQFGLVFNTDFRKEE